MIEVATKAEDSDEVEDAKVEVDLPEDTVTLEVIINIRECVVL